MRSITAVVGWLVVCVSIRLAAAQPGGAAPQPPPQPQQPPAPLPPPPPQGTQPQPPLPPPPPPQGTQPYPPYPPQPYGQPAPYGQPYGQPPPPYPPQPPPRSRRHDGEVIGDFAAVGALAGIDIIVRQDIDDGGLGTLVLLGGVVGGGAAGWLLTQKYEITPGAARATTIGLMAGAANGALLIQPTGWTRAESVLGLLFVGSAIGATGGFVYGQATDLTEGQATFIGNITLLGAATAAFGAISASGDGEFGDWENGSLAIGLDAGLAAGVLIAPKLTWSARRARVVMAATGVGALVGGMLAGLTTQKETSGIDGTVEKEANGDVVAACMTAGMWGGFALGVLMTGDSPPDPKFSQPSSGGAVTSYAPWVGAQGTLGVMAGGSW